jgi:two-component system sensor histidine kinase/response regulator
LEILGQVASSGAAVCMVSDVRLPDMDGFELLKAVKSSADSAQLRFAFLTGDSDAGMQARAMQLGADAFFNKPVRWDDLVQTARALQKLAART